MRGSPGSRMDGVARDVDPRSIDSQRLRAVGGLAALLAFVVVVGVNAGVARVAAADPSPGGASTVTTGADAGAGQALFLATCAACHGTQGQGTAAAPSLRHAGTALVDFMLRTGRMPLPELGQPARRGDQVLTDRQIADILAYLAPVMDGPSVPVVVTSAAQIGRGRELFVANCAACHGATGAGDAIGGGIVAPSLHQSTALDVAEAVTGGPNPMPRYSFTPQDLGALASYVQLLRDPPHPGGSAVAALGPVSEGFIAGAVALVVVLVVLRWIARSRRADQAHPAPDDAQPWSEEGR